MLRLAAENLRDTVLTPPCRAAMGSTRKVGTRKEAEALLDAAGFTVSLANSELAARGKEPISLEH